MAHSFDPSVFQRLAEVAPVGMIAHSDGVVQWANDAAAALVGYPSPAALVGKPVLSFVSPESQPQVTARMMAMLETGQPAPLREELFLHRDGHSFPVEVMGTLVEDGVVLVVVRDISERKQAEERFRALFDEVPVGVWEEDLSGAKRIVDDLRAQGVTDFAAHFAARPEDVAACAMAVKVLDVNATACTMLGARDKEELVANLHKVFLPEALEDFAAQLIQLTSGRRATVTDGWNGTLDGGRRWVGVRSVLAAGHEHDWSRLLVTTIDLTERRQAAEERLELKERLRHAEKLEAVGRLAGGVAHDFNNILAAVLGLAELSVEDTAPGTALHDNQVQIREAALRARDLVRQILTLGRRDRPEPRPLDVGAVVAEALPLARVGIPSTVAVETQIDPGAGVALADQTQLHQIVLNLCANARDAVGAQGRIEVGVAAVEVPTDEPDLGKGAWVRLRVRDDGAGMDQATRRRLFEPYLTTKGETGGHGLGLAVVHGIVQSAGGAIRVQSAPGQGSTFDVYLPRVDQHPNPQAGPDAAPGGHERVLLVDDEAVVRLTHRRLLESLGYRVTDAADGEEALRLLRGDPSGFDLVLTDQTMPRLSGSELAQAWLAERPQARIVVCTGYSDVVDEPRARGLGVRALLAKPIRRAVLASTLRRVLDEQ